MDNLILKISEAFYTDKSNVYIYLNCEVKDNICIPKKINISDYEKITNETTSETITVIETYFRDLVKMEFLENKSVYYVKKTSNGEIINNNLIISNEFEEINSLNFPNIDSGHYKTTKITKKFNFKYDTIDLLLINDILTIKIKEKLFNKKKLENEILEIIKKFY
jgi:hypothetical protein